MINKLLVAHFKPLHKDQSLSIHFSKDKLSTQVYILYIVLLVHEEVLGILLDIYFSFYLMLLLLLNMFRYDNCVPLFTLVWHKYSNILLTWSFYIQMMIKGWSLTYISWIIASLVTHLIFCAIFTYQFKKIEYYYRRGFSFYDLFNEL